MPRAVKGKYRVVHSGLDSHEQGAIIDADTHLSHLDEAGKQRLIELGAIERYKPETEDDGDEDAFTGAAAGLLAAGAVALTPPKSATHAPSLPTGTPAPDVRTQIGDTGQNPTNPNAGGQQTNPADESAQQRALSVPDNASAANMTPSDPAQDSPAEKAPDVAAGPPQAAAPPQPRPRAPHTLNKEDLAARAKAAGLTDEQVEGMSRNDLIAAVRQAEAGG